MVSAVRSIAWRFMLKGTEKGSFSAMTLFAWLAIGVGVGTMSSLLSVMYGLESSLRDNVLRAYPHILVRRVAGKDGVASIEAFTKTLSAQPGVSRVMPYVEAEMIAQTPSRTMGVVVWGVPDSEWKRIGESVERGKTPDANSPNVQGVLGVELSNHLNADIDDKVELISPLKKKGLLGSVPQTHQIEITGLYQSGHYEFDKQYLFLPLLDAQDIVGKGDTISGWHVWTEHMDDADSIARTLKPIVPSGWEVQSWTQFNEALFHSLKLEQLSMFLILSFAVVIAVMNIAITLMMHVSHKRKNIGVLRALGASAQQIRSIFVWQGAFLGLVGMSIGAVLSVVLIVYIQKYYQFPDIYYQRSVPVEIRPLSIVMVFLVASILIFIATLYPAVKASKMDPIEAIRE
jgi:lipoprotein-releasing system permease protein